ncbi:MAG TPA: NAD-dependent epimerase/dehydratase family protein [Actinobacteria bacterium]|nr:NAD-dependent epimerase/dehydratase family protein [Actinomycetota bacterium]
MKMLVTGCAGFIGSHLSEKLCGMGEDVVGIDCFTDYYPKATKEANLEKLKGCKNFKFVEADLNEIDLELLLKDTDAVFHQAAQAGVRASWGKSFEIYTKNNILVTQKLLEAAKKSNLKKFIYASSSSVYGDAEKLPLKETNVPKPISPYGVSKLAAEHLCYLYWKNFGVPTVSLRYFTVYGPRQRPDMAFNKFIKAVLKGEEIVVYGDGKQTRDFTFISDAIDANIAALELASAGTIFNIGGGSRVFLIDAIKTIEELAGQKAKIKYIEKQKGDVRDTLADTSLAKSLIGYEPKVNLKEGLEEETKWMKKLFKVS